jgi:hypothetical protein
LEKEEVPFFIHLLTLFQEVLYNKAFKYCCQDNNVEQIMTFLSCALIVLCGNKLQYYHVFVDTRLKCLALNQSASEDLLATQENLEIIRVSFVREIMRMLTEEDLQSIFGMLRVMEDKSIKFCSIHDLSSMWLKLRMIVRLVHLMQNFLFNVQSSKNSQEVNGAVNGLLTMLRSLHDVLDQILVIIMSFSIPCSTIESVKRMMKHSSHQKPVVAVASCSVAANPFDLLLSELDCGPRTFDYLWSCLSNNGSLQCIQIGFAKRDFKRFFKIHYK